MFFLYEILNIYEQIYIYYKTGFLLFMKEFLNIYYKLINLKYNFK